MVSPVRRPDFGLRLNSDGLQAGNDSLTLPDMALSRLYQTRILELNRAPLNYGELNDATHRAHGVDALCGDDLQIQLRVDSNGIIEQACWSGQACAVTSASASLLTEWLTGRHQADVEVGLAAFRRLLTDQPTPEHPNLGELALLGPVGGFPSRVKNALLPWQTVLDALDQPSQRSSP